MYTTETVIQLMPNPYAGKEGDTIRTDGYVHVGNMGHLYVESYSDKAADTGCPPNQVLVLAPGTWRSYKSVTSFASVKS